MTDPRPLTDAQAERLHLLIEHSARLIQAATHVLAEGYTDDASEHLTQALGRAMVPRRMMWLRGDYDWDVSCQAADDGYLEVIKALRHNTFTYGELRNG